MAYVIKITNKNNDPNSASLSKLYLGSIAPSLIVNPDTPYSNYESDMSLSDGSVLVPLYQRQQFVKIPVSSVLVINTDNSCEAIYYAQCKVNNSAILVDPDPFGGSSGGGTLIEKTITENGTYLASQDNADGYSLVDVNVPNSYSAEDEWKVVSNGTLVSQLTHKSITTNGIGIDTTTYSSVDVDVPNTYTSEDNGKVVSNGNLVSQTAYPITITQNDTYDTTNYNSVTVNVSGGGGIGGSDVRFIDYDGTVVQTYSAEDFANLSAMPENPTHTGLTSQGWNWSLADAKAYVASSGKLDIGQMYITSDGKTRIYITIVNGSLGYDLHLSLDSDTELDVDWGDNSAHTTWTSDDGVYYKTHTYPDKGEYVISVTVVSGAFDMNSPREQNTTTKVEIGSSVNSIVYEAFKECKTLASITIPSSVTYIDQGAFSNCSALSSITIPSSVDSIENSTFYGCSALSSITIPSNVTSIDEYAFQECSGMSSITFESTTPPVLSGDLSIETTCIIRVPQGTLSDYTSASDYPDPNDYIYVEY